MTNRLLIMVMAALIGGCGTSTSSGGGGSGASGGSGTGGVGGSGGAGGAVQPRMSFFVSSAGSGVAGGDFGGLAGADERCQTLADAVGAGDLTWRAYLSSSAEDARSRIGAGPWYNQALVLVANNVDELHENGLEPREEIGGDPVDTIVLDENGDTVPAVEHDIVTGSEEDGTVFADRTCQDWTSDSGTDVAQVGHSDIPPPTFEPSWNSAHESESCTEQGLALRLGNGRVYCFAL